MFFPLACEHIVRLARVLQQPCGHILLVRQTIQVMRFLFSMSWFLFSFQIGFGGVGRRSCTKIAAYIAGCGYHQLAAATVVSCPQQSAGQEGREGRAGWRGAEWREELRSVLVECGVHCKPVVLLTSNTACGQEQVSSFSFRFYTFIAILCHPLEGVFQCRARVVGGWRGGWTV